MLAAGAAFVASPGQGRLGLAAMLVIVTSIVTGSKARRSLGTNKLLPLESGPFAAPCTSHSNGERLREHTRCGGNLCGGLDRALAAASPPDNRFVEAHDCLTQPSLKLGER